MSRIQKILRYSQFILPAFALVVFSILAHAQDHNTHDMSGMDMSKPQPQKKKPNIRHDAPTDKDKQDKTTHDKAHGETHDATPPTPAPSPTPTQTPMPAPEASPTPTPETMNIPQMQMSHDEMTAKPSAAPSAQPKSSTYQQATHGMSSHESHDNMNMSMDMSNPSSLMTMSDDGDMGIRVGTSHEHIMSMGQMGSGTAWQPASSPLWMTHRSYGDWLVMLHGEAKLGVNSQGGARGVTKFESMNWLMPMAFHRLGRGTIELRGMFSLEPLTIPKGGTPELFQTGENYKGKPLIDKQHPHDLFMELSADYTMPVGEHGTFYTYFGFPGEPALGPVAFMHRASASENPTAPLSHHLQDSTHISFGVLTSGFTYRKFKLEGSLFNGREPDENRYNFEFHPFDSYAARLSFAPSKNWAMQISHGYLKNPEQLEPGTTRRTTASIQYNRPFARGNWATNLIWGRNDIHSNMGERSHLNGYTAESTLNFLDKNYLYTRLELVDKNELLTGEDRARLNLKDEHPSFRIGAYTFGYVRDVANVKGLLVGVGSDVTFYSKPAALDVLYGNNPVSSKIFVRIRPRRMTMEGMHMNHPGTTKANENIDRMGNEMKHPQQ